jgi:hypothetical protein
MSYVEMTKIASGVRELTDTELAMVAGGGVWGDLAKLAGAVLGRAVIGGALGGTVGAGAVILGVELYKGYDSSANPNMNDPMPIGDAAL